MSSERAYEGLTDRQVRNYFIWLAVFVVATGAAYSIGVQDGREQIVTEQEAYQPAFVITPAP